MEELADMILMESVDGRRVALRKIPDRFVRETLERSDSGREALVVTRGAV